MATEPVTVAAEAPEAPAKPRELTSLSDKQYQEWRITGEIPAEGVKEEPEAKADEKKPPEKAETASEPGADAKQEQRKEKKPGSMGYGELRAKIAELEAKIAAGDKPKVADETAERKEKAETKRPAKPTPNDVDEKGQPKFATYEDYVDALTDWKTDEKFAAFREDASKETAKQAKDAEIQAVNKQIEDMWKAKVGEARKKHADFDEFALDPKLPVKAGSVVDAWCLDSDIGADILYHFGKNPAELDRINALSPFAAARELTRLEEKLAAPPAPEHKATKAPPPAREVGGRGTAAVDEVTKAVADDDVRAYINAQNRREIASKTR